VSKNYCNRVRMEKEQRGWYNVCSTLVKGGGTAVGKWESNEVNWLHSFLIKTPWDSCSRLIHVQGLWALSQQLPVENQNAHNLIFLLSYSVWGQTPWKAEGLSYKLFQRCYCVGFGIAQWTIIIGRYFPK
jgi:hypothetical protein